MNKLTKVGCSALCGSLAVIASANAGTLTVTGGADMTWMSKDNDVTGQPLGIGSNTTLNGSGELDNGWTFSVAIANLNLQAYSSAAVNLDMGGLGALNFNQGDSANGIQAYDDLMPTAWEEAHGAGLSTGIRGLVSGVGTSQNIQYTLPLGEVSQIAFAVAPDIGTADTNDKATSNANEGKAGGYDITLRMNPSLGTEILSGLNMYVGAHTATVYNNLANTDEPWQGVGAVTYSLGPVSLGHQWSFEYSGEKATNKHQSYKAHGYGVAFNVNDDLSVSYGKMEGRKETYTHSKVQRGPKDRLVEVESVQVAYTIGGASIRFANVEANNVFYNADDNKEANIISLGLAF
jgi:hypothetical protein